MAGDEASIVKMELEAVEWEMKRVRWGVDGMIGEERWEEGIGWFGGGLRV